MVHSLFNCHAVSLFLAHPHFYLLYAIFSILTFVYILFICKFGFAYRKLHYFYSFLNIIAQLSSKSRIQVKIVFNTAIILKTSFLGSKVKTLFCS